MVDIYVRVTVDELCRRKLSTSSNYLDKGGLTGYSVDRVFAGT